MKPKHYKAIKGILKRNLKYCPWIENENIESYIEQISGELEELKQAIKNKDNENLTEELGDVFLDIMNMINIAERDKLVKSDEVFESIIAKIKRRKPYIFKNKKVSLDESWKIWREAKKKEKESKGKRVKNKEGKL